MYGLYTLHIRLKEQISCCFNTCANGAYVCAFHTLPNVDSSSPEEQRKQKAKLSHSEVKNAKCLQKPESSSSLSRWLTAAPSPVQNISTASTPKTHKMASSNNTIKNDSFKRKRVDNISGSEGEEEELDSEVDSISDDLESDDDEDNISPHLQDEIIQFLQEASLDELALISLCSVKKAQKIISLRPFNSWKDVVCMLVGTLHCFFYCLTWFCGYVVVPTICMCFSTERAVF